MLHVDDKPETLHIYVVREEVPKPSAFSHFPLGVGSCIHRSSFYRRPL